MAFAQIGVPATPRLTFPEFAADPPATRVDASLRCDRVHECAVLWFAEVSRRGLYRQLGHVGLQLYATQVLRFSGNRYYQFKRLADDLDRLPILREAVETGEIGWTKVQQIALVVTGTTQAAWVAKAATCRPAAQLAFDTVVPPVADAAARLVADPPTTIRLRDAWLPIDSFSRSPSREAAGHLRRRPH